MQVKDRSWKEVRGARMELEGKYVEQGQKLEKGLGAKEGSCRESWGGTEGPGSRQGLTPRAEAVLSPLPCPHLRCDVSVRHRHQPGSPAGARHGTPRSNPPGELWLAVPRGRSAHAPCLVLQSSAGPARPGPSRPAGAAPGRAGRLKRGRAALGRVEPHRAGRG